MLRIVKPSRLLLLALSLSCANMVCAMDIVVTTNSDVAGVNGSLRQALQFNAFLGGGNAILFSNTVTGTISLS